MVRLQTTNAKIKNSWVTLGLVVQTFGSFLLFRMVNRGKNYCPFSRLRRFFLQELLFFQS